MKALMIISITFLMAGVAQAKKNCTDQPKEKWMNVDHFKQKLKDEGYTIRKFKQPGTCYEIYGKNKAGKSVEIYFDPTDGRIVKSK